MKKSVMQPHTKEPMAACQCKTGSDDGLGPPESEKKSATPVWPQQVPSEKRGGKTVLNVRKRTPDCNERNLNLHTCPVSHSVMWPVFICFIAYLICLSPLIGL